MQDSECSAMSKSEAVVAVLAGVQSNHVEEIIGKWDM